jgi:CTP synthase (UTP-ammonia lyase)
MQTVVIMLHVTQGLKLLFAMATACVFCMEIVITSIMATLGNMEMDVTD